MAEGSSSEIRLHPLVILSIADHYARRAAQQVRGGSGGRTRVIGALLGVQSGRRVEVQQILEINPNRELAAAASAHAASELAVCEEDFRCDLELFKKVFPSCELLGWYSSGAEFCDADREFHRKIVCQWNESPLFLMLDPAASAESKELPIRIYESVVLTVRDVPAVDFVRASFTLEAEETERVVVDHVAKTSGSNNDGTVAAVVSPFTATLAAVKALQQRIRVLISYLHDVATNQVETNFELLRSIKSIVNRLPAMDNSVFRGDFRAEQDDSVLVNLLASMTKGEAMLSEIVEKYNSTFHSQKRGSLGGGMSRH